MFKVLLNKLLKHSTTAILTTAVLGALYLQLSLLSGELELQRQQYETNVGQMATNLNDRVRLHIRRKSMGTVPLQFPHPWGLPRCAGPAIKLKIYMAWAE